jgi:hypothetical protein
VLVFDTSAYINGQKNHFPPAVFPSVWNRVAEAIDDGRVILPREVYRELTAQDDRVSIWIKKHSAAVAEPSREVQRRAGELMAQFPPHGTRNAADPFVLAEAQTRQFTVTTYEGQSFSGVPTKRWPRSMPGVCRRFGIACCTVPEALGMLGVSI